MICDVLYWIAAVSFVAMIVCFAVILAREVDKKK